MTDKEFEDIRSRYLEEFPNQSFVDIAAKLDSYTDKEWAEKLRFYNLLNRMFAQGSGYLYYSDRYFIFQDEYRSFFRDEVEKIESFPIPTVRAYEAFLYGRYDKTQMLLREFYVERGEDMKEKNIVFLLTCFKNGFPGMWNGIIELAKDLHSDDRIVRLCEAIKDYYALYEGEKADYDSQIDVLSRNLVDDPEGRIVNDILAFTYYLNHMWNNSIACFEKYDDYRDCIFDKYDRCFFLGYAHSQIREHKIAVSYYESIIEDYPEFSYTLNNLGYEYLKLKRFDKALDAFRRCLDEGITLKSAANNYLRTLLAMERYSDAKAFLKETDQFIYKSIKTKVQNAPNTNKRINKSEYDSIKLDEIEEEDSAVSDEGIKALEGITKGSQFSTEKILEDDLTMKIESGMAEAIFGKNLKIYRRKGQYGRQYIIDVGRLDLLCEDDDGNLYIIELKKDSGYDDPYVQTRAYIDWFEKNKPAGAKDIYGIICLNGPTDDVIRRVKADNQMSLYNYLVEYRKVE